MNLLVNRLKSFESLVRVKIPLNPPMNNQIQQTNLRKLQFALDFALTKLFKKLSFDPRQLFNKLSRVCYEICLCKYWAVAAKYLDLATGIYNSVWLHLQTTNERHQMFKETLNIMLHNWPSGSQLKTAQLLSISADHGNNWKTRPNLRELT